MLCGPHTPPMYSRAVYALWSWFCAQMWGGELTPCNDGHEAWLVQSFILGIRDPCPARTETPGFFVVLTATVRRAGTRSTGGEGTAPCLQQIE